MKVLCGTKVRSHSVGTAAGWLTAGPHFSSERDSLSHPAAWRKMGKPAGGSISLKCTAKC